MKIEVVGFGDRIPLRYVYKLCGGDNISPEVVWSNFPKETKSFAITMFDPDAPTDHGWWHWMVVNIPTNINHLPEGAGNLNSPYFDIALQTINDYGEIGYGGPCPPPGPPHRYIITVYALSIEGFDVDRNINPQLLAKYIQEYTIDKDSQMSLYQRGWV